MLNTSDIELGSTVSFELHPSMLIAAGYTRAKVEGILGAADARRYADIDALHVQVYPTLPPGTPNRADGYYYLKLKLISGESTIVGLPWIKDNTYQKVEAGTLRFIIQDVNQSDETIVREALAGLGYRMLQVEYVS